MFHSFRGTALTYFTNAAMEKFRPLRLAAPAMDLFRLDLGLVHPGPFLGRSLPSGFTVFLRGQIGVTLGTI